jgi:hypothetical protein
VRPSVSGKRAVNFAMSSSLPKYFCFFATRKEIVSKGETKKELFLFVTK